MWRGVANEEVGIDPIYVHLGLTDPEVLLALKDYPAGRAQHEFLELAIRIGVMSLKAARGVVDGEAIRESGEKLISQLTERMQGHRELIDRTLEGTLRMYFDPSNGHFAARVASLTHDDGELALLVRRQLTSEGERLKEMMGEFLGENGELARLMKPGEGNAFISDLQGRMQALLRAQSETIVGQFSLDNQGSALSRLVRELKEQTGDVSKALATRMEDVVSEFSLDKPDSALSRLVNRVEDAQKKITDEFSLDASGSALKRMLDEVTAKIAEGQKSSSDFQSEVLQILSGLQAQRKAEARSTTHGAEFEAKVGELLSEQCVRSNDICEESGSTTGLIRMCKVGDFVISLGQDNVAAGSKIVVEAKEFQNYTLKSTLEEADEARRNRGAQVSLFIHSAKTAPKGLDALTRHGHDIIAIWDAEDPLSDVVVKAGLMLAKALCAKQATKSQKEESSWVVIDKSVEAMRKQISNFAELRTSAETIERAAEKSLDRIRIMQKGLEDALTAMETHLSGMRQEG